MVGVRIHVAQALIIIVGCMIVVMGIVVQMVHINLVIRYVVVAVVVQVVLLARQEVLLHHHVRHYLVKQDVHMVQRVAQMVVVVPELVVSHIHIVIPVRVDRMHQAHLVVMGLREQ